jgi:hypothetical protein
MSNPTARLVLQCERRRAVLTGMVEKFGLSDSRTVAQSERVDGLVNKVMKRRLANYTNKCYGLPSNSYIGVMGK